MTPLLLSIDTMIGRGVNLGIKLILDLVIIVSSASGCCFSCGLNRCRFSENIVVVDDGDGGGDMIGTEGINTLLFIFRSLIEISRFGV
jgi:hypothetical protein